jgi:hypothetical protein
VTLRDWMDKVVFGRKGQKAEPAARPAPREPHDMFVNPPPPTHTPEEKEVVDEEADRERPPPGDPHNL